MSTSILIVDDEPNIRTVIRLTLEAAGYSVGEASSGEEALERYHDGTTWDLVLLDERMPGIDGLETLRQLRRGDPDVTVVMVTAYASIDLAVDAMKLGASDFVRKPMTPDTLRAAVEGALVKARGEWTPVTPSQIASGNRPYEVWVTNGFRIRHAAEGASVTEQRYDLIHGEGQPIRSVVVVFEPALAAIVAQQAGRSLDADHTFWIRQGAFALTHYVWTHADVPEGARLVINRMSDDLIKAARGRRA